ncbi:peptidase domain-containing ABC transporter [Enterobacillus tribolii]|uniref:ATP-binding cassette subfamily B protein RaxB n=1 Tax=Enterobacillus tribolii TaxID=1487935 RepID=A0A370R4G9_9GAMM|nr:ATP-binding cassette domain-containing protein [Enterobacillus tribolii]MBW7983274.1 ATP-binding cassette domain-containing protein [Enterobacillus tribolii]RDK97332.1 ATP-binding cassette subfamily B protein RaxB [Enterobacillus tribolii]
MEFNIIPTVVIQNEANECGLACIAMFAESQGIQITLDELREKYPASSHGMTMKQVCEVLHELSLPVCPVIFEFNELRELPLPAILHYGAGHFVLLAWRRGENICVMNPAIGQQLIPAAALKEQISGYAVILPADYQPDQQKIKAAKREQRQKRLSFLSLRDTAAIKGIYRLMLIAFAISLTLFIMPIMVSSAINDVYSSAGAIEFPYLLYISVFILSSLLGLWVKFLSEGFIRRFILVKSASGFSSLLNNSLTYFEKRAPGDIYTRFLSWQNANGKKIDLDNVLRIDWLIVVIAFLVMSYINFSLALVSFAGVTLMGIISIWAMYRDRFYTQLIEQQGAEQNDHIMETIQGFSTIKAAGLVTDRQLAFSRFSSRLFNTLQRRNIYETIKNNIYQLVNSLEMILFMMIALPQLKNGGMTLGAFFAYGFIKQIFYSNVTSIFFAILEKNKISIIDARARDIFPTQPQNAASSAPVAVKQFEHELSLHNIEFAYDREKSLFSDFSLTVAKRSAIAIVGQSGCGKSTLLKIMTGLLPATQGHITVDAVSYQDEALSALSFLQNQDDILFNGSVRENITLFSAVSPAQEALVQRLIEAVDLQPAIAALPGGLNALIRESHAGLSLGQRQRLLLARALYSQRQILILDEPTANLDQDTALRVMTNIIELCREQQKTLIVVTHSVELQPLFDRVYEMSEGKLLNPPASPASEQEAQCL